MKELCVLCDFDGTITQKDGLYEFIKTYASEGWERLEQNWETGKISSKDCLIKQFNLVSNLSENLIKTFVENVEIDENFPKFYHLLSSQNIDFYIVSDGIDYFINQTLLKYKISNVKIISNHGEFIKNKFVITFPNDYSLCKNNAGTCKCKVLENLRKQYKKITYIGDGVSDYCVADKADIIFAKLSLKNFCIKNNIKHIPFNSFEDIMQLKNIY